MSKLIDLTGQKFGRLTAISHYSVPTGRGKSTKVYWLCKCECGNEISVSLTNLKWGHTKSCGCLKHSSEKHGTHRLSKTRIYKIWLGIKKRCYNPNYVEFNLYGGRGIKMCDEWFNDFLPFYNWSMNNGYAKDLSIDRINIDGNYCPENCRWANTFIQTNNRRNNHYITYKGETHTIKEWSIIKGLTYSALQHRIDRKWDIEKALNTPMLNSHNP